MSRTELKNVQVTYNVIVLQFNIAEMYKMIKETEEGDDDCSFRNYDEAKYDEDQHKHDHY